MDNRLNDIRDALAKPTFEPTRLEECAASLLQERYPGIRWVHGGHDGGVDLETPDGEGEPWPGVCTTSSDVEGNLRRSLQRFRATGGHRSQVLLVTTQAIEPPRHRNLRDLAREEGFVLVETIERENLAELLYRCPRWSNQLLGIAADAPVLSPIPLTSRPAPPIELVGREEDLAWLREAEGDRLLVGEPGSGKTFLLRTLAREEWGLFVVSDNRDALHAAVLEQGPKRLIVDDVLDDTSTITLLQQLRESLEREFRFDIVATTWPSPSRRDAVMNALRIGDTESRTLLPMTMKEIQTVYEACGITEASLEGQVDPPNAALRWLIDQSANRPGLAVSLAELLYRGHLAEVFEGTAITRDLTQAVEQVVGRDSSLLLACFALGGGAGVSLEHVASVAERSSTDLVWITAEQMAGGVLTERRGGDNTFVVRPAALRPILVRDAFFAPGGPRLPFLHQLLSRAEDKSAATLVLVQARLRGGRVEEHFLREQLLAHGRADAWFVYASLDRERAAWALENCAAARAGITIEDLAEATLSLVPSETIDRLLDRGRSETKSIWQAPGRNLRLLRTWIQDLRWGTHVLMERRRQVASRLEPYVRRGGDRSVAVEVLLLTLDARLESSERSPLGDTLRSSVAVVPIAMLPALEELWSQHRQILIPIDRETLWKLQSVLWGYSYPKTVGPTTPELEASLRTFGARILADLASSAELGAGMRSAFARMAERLGHPLELELDSNFELLFPEQDLDPAHPDAEHERDALVEELAVRWVSMDPKAAAERLSTLESEAAIIGQSHPRHTPELVKAMARQCASPEAWARVLIEAELPGDLVEPWLERLLDTEPARLEALLLDCVARGLYPGFVVSLAIRMYGPPDSLQESLNDTLQGWVRVVRAEAYRGSVPRSTLGWLLRHSNDEVAFAAAIGTWQHLPKGRPSGDLADAWEAAILRYRTRETRQHSEPAFFDYDLAEIFIDDPKLAEAFVARVLEAGEIRRPVDANGALGQALLSLDEAARARLVEGATSSPVLLFMARWLVRRSAYIYKALLARTLAESEREAIHLAPLVGRPDDANWEALARLALEQGYEPEAIANAAIWGTGGGIDGHVRDLSSDRYWPPWIAAFRALESNSDPRLSEVGRIGGDAVEQESADDKSKARRMAIYGI